MRSVGIWHRNTVSSCPDPKTARPKETLCYQMRFSGSCSSASFLGLAGKDEWEQAWVNAIADMVKDFVMTTMLPFVPVALGMEEGDKVGSQRSPLVRCYFVSGQAHQ